MPIDPVISKADRVHAEACAFVDKLVNVVVPDEDPLIELGSLVARIDDTGISRDALITTLAAAVLRLAKTEILNA